MSMGMLQNGSSAEQMDSDDDSMPELVSASDSDSDSYSPRAVHHSRFEVQSRGALHYHGLFYDEMWAVSRETVAQVDYLIRYMSK